MLLELRVELFDFYHSQDSLGMTTFDTVAKKKKKDEAPFLGYSHAAMFSAHGNANLYK